MQDIKPSLRYIWKKFRLIIDNHHKHHIFNLIIKSYNKNVINKLIIYLISMEILKEKFHSQT